MGNLGALQLLGGGLLCDQYDLQQCCSGKLPGTALLPWGLCFGTGVNIFGCTK